MQRISTYEIALDVHRRKRSREMRPGNNSTTTNAVSGGLGHWNSPVPYLFGGLGLMLGLITIALVILACSYRKYSPDNSTSDQTDDEKSTKQVGMQMEMEPKVVVIMAGDDNPTYLAKPVSVAANCTCNQQTEDHQQV